MREEIARLDKEAANIFHDCAMALQSQFDSMDKTQEKKPPCKQS